MTNRRRFIKAAGVFVPAMFGITASRSQVLTLRDPAFVALVAEGVGGAPEPSCSNERNGNTVPSEGVLILNNASGFLDYAVQFTASANYDPCKVTVWLDKNDSPTGNLWMSFWSSTGSPPEPDARIGDESSPYDVTGLTGVEQEVTFTWAGPSLTISTVYFLAFRFSTGNSTNYVKAHDDTGMVNLDNRWVRSIDNGATWTEVNKNREPKHAIYST